MTQYHQDPDNFLLRKLSPAKKELQIRKGAIDTDGLMDMKFEEKVPDHEKVTQFWKNADTLASCDQDSPFNRPKS